MSAGLHEYHRDAGFRASRMNIDHLRRNNFVANSLARMMAFFDGKELTFELFSTPILPTLPQYQPQWFRELLRDKRNFNDAVSLLVNTSIVSPSIESGAYTMHSVVQGIYVNECPKSQRMEVVLLCASLIASAIPQKSDPHLLVLRERLLPHANVVFEHVQRLEMTLPSETLNSNISLVYLRFGSLFEGVAQYDSAKQALEKCLEARSRCQRQDNEATLDATYNLANFYSTHAEMAPGNLQKALELYKRAVAGYERIFSSNHSSTCDALNNLSCLYETLGNLKEAKTCALRSMKFQSGIQAFEQLDFDEQEGLDPDAVSNLAGIFRREGSYSMAEKLYKYSLRKFRQNDNKKNQTAAYDMMNNLGLLYTDQSRLKDAEDLLHTALHGKIAAWGANHSSTLNSKNNLANVYIEQDREVEAEKLLLEIIHACSTNEGNGFGVASALHNLGNLYHKVKRYPDAEQMYLRAYTTKRSIYGVDHSRTLDTANNLCVLYKDQGRFDESETWIHRTYNGYLRAFGGPSRHSANALKLRGNLKKRQGLSEDAIKYYEESLVAFEESVGKDHLETAHAVYNLGCMYEDMKDVERAFPLMRRAVDSYRRLLPKGSKQTLDAIWILACVQEQAGKYREALANMKLCAKGFSDLKGADHPITKSAQTNISRLQSLVENTSQVEHLQMQIVR